MSDCLTLCSAAARHGAVPDSASEPPPSYELPVGASTAAGGVHPVGAEGEQAAGHRAAAHTQRRTAGTGRYVIEGCTVDRGTVPGTGILYR